MTSSGDRDWQTQSNTTLIQSSLDALDQGVTVFDADLKLVFANRAFLELRDLPPYLGKVGTRFEEQVRYRAERGDYGPGDVEGLVREHVELAEKFEAHRTERTQLDGKVLEIRGDPLSGGGFIATYTDITDRKRAEESLQTATAELELAGSAHEMQGQKMAAMLEELSIAKQHLGAANRAKSEFLATMSHELRTPLNAIIGFSEIIGTETFGPIGNVKYRDYARDIHESGQHLLDLINDILDISKVESGMEELYEENVDISVVADSVLRLVRQRAQKHGVKLELELSDESPALRVDVRKLKQILVNLLSNAIKFTKAGGTVTLKGWGRIESGYVFQVIDTGIGIAPEDIPKALSQFGQVDNALNRQHEGTGLGLPLTKSLVELHGGSMDLQSDVGVGTTVTVRFPADRIVASPDVKQSLSAAVSKAS
ncbi:MAG: PAS-domain containing protein [Proteobacteria bacterium]|nr:PAS-domain containing protein [Pseudomonadota bacterium]